jgi:hypothetical protein
MRFFASWWERVPVQRIGTAIVVIVLVGFIGTHLDGSQSGSLSSKFMFLPSGEVWT